MNVCKALADMEQDAKMEGRKEGALLKQISNFRKMSDKRMSASKISEILDEPFEFVEKVLSCIQRHPEWDDQRILCEIKKRSRTEI